MRKMTNIEAKPKNAASGNVFAGRTIVVTGTLENFTRTSINEKIESLGARAGSAVSSKTDYLIAGEKAGSKLAKARTLGITVLSEREFLDMAESA
jgi:DNA ligase (NAD+)